ncbi:MAG: T9SS type A sorting domain-containing protein, partial [Saprospiraceae bacterium]
MQHDFRDIYGSILMDWFEVSESDVRSLLYQDFQHLPILQVCSSTSTQPEANHDAIEVNAYPNPFWEWTTISFQSGNEWCKLSVFDAAGNEIRVLSNQRLSAGEHQIRFEAHDLPAGSYYFRLQLDGRMKTRKMVKI